MITTESWLYRDTESARVHMKNITLASKNNILDGNYPIKIFDLRTLLINKADMSNISEAHSFIYI